MQTVPAKTILSRNKSTAWFGCEYNMNLYRGCSHGCIYCDSRSTCYHIDNFDTVHVKENALPILRDELAKRIRTGVVASGAMSDPYNPFEREQRTTRHSLELLNAYHYGAALCTKSDLIARDIDVLQDIRTHSPVLCKITITAADDATAAKIEPRVASTSARFSAIKQLSNTGLFTGVLMMPLLPFITDTDDNVRSIVSLAAENGARFIYPSFGLTMRTGQREYFLQQLDSRFPKQNLSAKYTARYGSRYHCASPRAQKLWTLFAELCQQHGLLYNMPDIVRAYRQGYTSTQLSFL